MTEEDQDKPFGILLATTFFMLVGTYFFAVASFSNSKSQFFLIQITLTLAGCLLMIFLRIFLL